MFKEFFEALETTVNHFWRWFYFQERKWSAFNIFWPWFAVQESKLSAGWPWLADRQKMLAFVLIWLGINSLIIQGLYGNYQRRILSFAVTPITQVSPYRAAEPVKISISKFQTNVSIVETQIVDGVWQIAEDAVAHLNSSARPGESGNIVMYGHNKEHLLASLRWVELGEEIAVETQNGVKHTYVVRDIQTVSPSDIQYVLPTSEERLTVYTCTGFLDTQRLVVIARPSSVSSL